jgi:hypothetical protein
MREKNGQCPKWWPVAQVKWGGGGYSFCFSATSDWHKLGLGLASEDACHFLALPFVIPSGDSGSNLDSSDEPLAGGGVLGVICMEQWQIYQPLDTVIGCQSILQIIIRLGFSSNRVTTDNKSTL